MIPSLLEALAAADLSGLVVEPASPPIDISGERNAIRVREPAFKTYFTLRDAHHFTVTPDEHTWQPLATFHEIGVGAMRRHPRGVFELILPAPTEARHWERSSTRR